MCRVNIGHLRVTVGTSTASLGQEFIPIVANLQGP